MYPWFDSWLNLFRAPLSGDVTQDYAPVTSWWSPQLEFNFAGNQKVEAEVVRNVASYGKQLGILTEAVLALGEGNDSSEIKRLRAQAEKIHEVKRRHAGATAAELKDRLDEFREKDPEAFEQLIAEFAPQT